VTGGNPRAAVRITDEEDESPLPWSEARKRLVDGRVYWLATTAVDGQPHVRPVLAVWVGGVLHTTSGRAARKTQALADDARCSLGLSTDGMDLVYEGEAVRITEQADLERVGVAYGEKYGWPVSVRDGAFHAPYGAPTAGPPPYDLYAIRPFRVFAFGTDDALAPRSTRFTF
jgi:hypothetical protein